MIHFACGQCGRNVRVSDSFGGKKGRCPFCKAVMQIPAAPQGAASSAAAGPTAAAGSESESAVPPPPHKAEDFSAGQESDLNLVPAGDPRHRTDRLDALLAGAAAEEDKAPATSQAVPQNMAASPRPAEPKQTLSPYVLVGGGIAGGAVLTGIVVAVLYLGGVLGGGGSEPPLPSQQTQTPGRDTPTPPRPNVKPRQPVQPPPPDQPLPPGPQPPVAEQPLPGQQPSPVQPPPPGQQPPPGQPPMMGDAGPTFRPDDRIAAAAAATPDGTFCIIYLDFAALADGLSKLPPGTKGIASTIAASKFWEGLTERIGEGGMPESATLFLVGESASVRTIFGDFHGVMPARPDRDPAGGLWSLLQADAQVPHFLVRLTGPGARRCTLMLLRKAGAVAGGPFPFDVMATHQSLRLIPAAKLGGKEMYLGTIRTIQEDGALPVNLGHVQRLRDHLSKVDTDEAAAVGCMLLKGFNTMNSALGVDGTKPSAVGPDAIVVFALDVDGPSTVVIRRLPPGAVDEVGRLATGMRTAPEGMGDARITGTGPQAIELLAKLVPGIRKLLLAALSQAGPVPSLAALPLPDAPPPAQEPQPQPQPEPQPEPQPQPQPVATEGVPFICTNPNCSSKGEKFEISKSEFPEGQVPFIPVKCPHCGQHSAVAAIKCSKCGKWIEVMAPKCPHCEGKGN